jgi:lysozyme
MSKKKSKFWKAIIVSLLFAGAVYTLFYHHKQITRYYYKSYRLFKRSLQHPPVGSFESVTFPDGYNIHGIDISHYQDDINWDDLRTTSIEGDTICFTFVFMKATEGPWKEDRAFDGNWQDAHLHHISCGAYHYYLPDKDAKKQAENYINSVSMHTGDLPPVIDIEETRGRSKQQIVDGIKIMADMLLDRYGVKPILYSNISFIEDYLSDDFPDYYFWVAHYYQEDLNISPEIHWLFWQHNDRAMLLGDDQKVDVNVFNGNPIEFRNILIQSRPRIRSGQK